MTSWGGGYGGGGAFISAFCTTILESWRPSTAECQSWEKPDASCCSASWAPAPASPSPCPCRELGSARSPATFTTARRGGYARLRLNRRKLRSRGRQ